MIAEANALGDTKILAGWAGAPWALSTSARSKIIEVAVKTISLAGQPPEEEREYRERFFSRGGSGGGGAVLSSWNLHRPLTACTILVRERRVRALPYTSLQGIWFGGQSLG